MKQTGSSHKAAAKRKRFFRASFAHIVLVAGCILFGFPFYWLISTSVKQQEELFADPPVWVPRWPARIQASPYIAQDEYRRPEPPSVVTEAMWEQLWPKFRAAAVRLLRETYLAPRGQQVQLTDADKESVARGIYASVTARLGADDRRALIRDPAEKLPEHLTERDCRTVWDNVYRALMIRDITMQDRGFVQYRLTEDAPVELWRVVSGPAKLTEAELGRKPAALVRYDFAKSNSFSLQTELPCPLEPSQFRRLTIPLRGDKSWHDVDLEVDVGGRLFKSGESLVLFSDLSQEAAWQIPDPDRVGASAFRDYLPLREVGRGSAEPGRVRVKLTFRRNGFLAVGWAKARRNYRDAINFVPLATYFRNTLLLVLLNVAGQLFSCSIVAYAFARLRWPGRDISFAVLLSTMMLPAQVTMIPVFLIYRYLGWYDTLQPLWIGSLFGNAFFIFLLRQFMRTIPRDLEDAAKIDGCSFFGLYWRIILPMMKPALAAVAIFSFMNAWNEFMGPLIYLNDQRLYPLSLGLYQFRIEHASDYGMLMAASALMIVPVVVVFFLAQKHFIQGVQLTGMKG